MEHELIDRKMKFIGASDSQARWCGSADPREYFEIGDELIVSNVREGSWSTTLEFQGIPGPTFNSVCFRLC